MRRPGQAHRIVGEAARPGAVEGERQAAAGDLRAGVDVAHQGDALAGLGGAQQEEVVGEGRAPVHPGVVRHPHRLQPQAPVAALRFLQQRVGQAIGRFAERRAFRQQARAGHRDQWRRHQRLHVEPGVVAEAVANGDVDALPTQVGELRRGLDTDFHLGMASTELAEARHQPGGGEGGLGAHRKGLPGIDGFQLGEACGDLLEGLAESGIDLLARRGQAHAVAGALEQVDAGALLQQP